MTMAQVNIIFTWAIVIWNVEKRASFVRAVRRCQTSLLAVAYAETAFDYSWFSLTRNYRMKNRNVWVLPFWWTMFASVCPRVPLNAKHLQYQYVLNGKPSDPYFISSLTAFLQGIFLRRWNWYLGTLLWCSQRIGNSHLRILSHAKCTDCCEFAIADIERSRSSGLTEWVML